MKLLEIWYRFVDKYFKSRSAGNIFLLHVMLICKLNQLAILHFLH